MIYPLQRKVRDQEVELHEAIPSLFLVHSINGQNTQFWKPVGQAMASLSPEQRVVFFLKEVQGLQYNNLRSSSYF